MDKPIEFVTRGRTLARYIGPGGDVAAAMTGFTPLSAFAMLVFILLYVPCVAAVSTLFKEMQSRRWAWFSIAWQIGCAYVVSLLVYQIGGLFL